MKMFSSIPEFEMPHNYHTSKQLEIKPMVGQSQKSRKIIE